MADGFPKPNVGEILLNNVVKPVVDEVGKMVEVGAQSITGSAQSQDPQAEANKKVEEQRKIQNIKNFLTQLQVNEQKLKQQRAAEQQKKMQEEQEASQTKQAKKQQEEQKKQANQNQAIIEKQRATEIRKGVGG